MRQRHARGFTLVEILVVIAIIGLLIGLLMPAVQASREAARRASCANNLHNQAIALHNYHDTHGRFPPGTKWTNGYATSWYLEVLPFLEQGNVSRAYDYSRPWSDPVNLATANTSLSVLRCPTSVVEFEGDSDYGGMSGSKLTAPSFETAFNNGVLIDEVDPAGRNMRFASITDGTSQTIAIAESSDRLPEEGRWIHGLNIFSHDNGGVDSLDPGEIFSRHPRVAVVAFADGSTRLLHSSIEPYVVGALCTRNLGELIDLSSF
jgi:prepilin-type N-terminal cleavage/methylation domain-containing protein